LKVDEVRAAVDAFRERTAHGYSSEDCFPPWYLQQEIHLSDTQAIAQSAETKKGYDFGIDAFYVDTSSTPKLVLVQAKYSDNLNLIRNGFRDLARSIPEVRRALESIETEEPRQNKVLVNLRAVMNNLDSKVRKKVELVFCVIHLNAEDSVIRAERTKTARNDLAEAVRTIFRNRVSLIRDVGPVEMGPTQQVVAPPSRTTLRVLSPVLYETETGAKMYMGLGVLSELVELYRMRKDDLFSRNVRYYLYSKRNTEKGPAAKMREALKLTCVDRVADPRLFALNHNGVTLHASDVDEMRDGLSMSDPFVLNGCQTIKNAYLFRHASIYRDKIDKKRWNEVRVPLKIVISSDSNLVTNITINNNRQNSISPAALRANDPVQLRLEESFRKRGIFYERQEGAYTNVENTSPELLQEEYENTRGTYVDMVDLGRSLAAVAGEISRAEHPNELFESDKGYSTCFSPKRVSSITLMTFLQNLHDVTGVILKKDLGLKPREDTTQGPRPSRFKYQTMCLLVRYLAKERMSRFVSQWGDGLYGDAMWGWNFRREVASKLRRGSGIRKYLAERFMRISQNKAEIIRQEFERAEKELKLTHSIDPFDVFKNL